MCLFMDQMQNERRQYKEEAVNRLLARLCGMILESILSNVAICNRWSVESTGYSIAK